MFRHFPARLMPLVAFAGAVWMMAFFMLSQGPAAANNITVDCIVTTGVWQSATPTPNDHIEGAGTIVDGKVYLISGYAGLDGNILLADNKVDVYDPATDTWESRNPAPFKLSHIQAAVAGTDIWIAGGFVGDNPGPVTDTVWRYDTVTDTWEAGPPLPEPRASGGFVHHAGKLHYLSGLESDRRTDTDTHWVLDLNDIAAGWQDAAPFPRPRNHFQAVVIDEIIYAVAGQLGHDVFNEDTAWLDAYDTRTGEWTQLSDLPMLRSHLEPGTFAMYGRIIAAGGKSGGRLGINWGTEYLTQYDPKSDTWVAMRDLPDLLYTPTAGEIDGQMVVTAGGNKWNIFQSETWISQITEDCLPEFTAQDDEYNYNSADYPEAQTFGSVLSNDDTDDADVIVELVTSATGGTLALNPDGTFTYTPVDNFTGLDSFTYQITADSITSDPATVSIVVPNPVPVAQDDSYSTDGQTLRVGAAEGVLSNDTDANNDTLTAILVEPISEGLLDFGASGAFTYTAPQTGSGVATFTYQVDDGTSLSNVATVTLNTAAVSLPLPMPTEAPPSDDPEPPPGLFYVEGTLTSGLIRPDFVLIPTRDPDTGGVVIADWYWITVRDAATNAVVFEDRFQGDAVCTWQECRMTPDAEMLPTGFMNGDYIALARMVDGGFVSGPSNTDDFSVNVPAPIVASSMSVDTITGRPVIRLLNDPNAQWYHLYMTDQNGGWVHQAWYARDEFTCDSTVCTLLPDANPVNGSYSAQMQAWGAGGYAGGGADSWSQPTTFSLRFGAPYQLTGLNRTTESEVPDQSFRWQASYGATWYEVWIGSSDFTMTAYQQWVSAVDLGCAGGGTCTLNPDIAFTSSEEYVWYLRAWGPGGLNQGENNGWTPGEAFTPGQ